MITLLQGDCLDWMCLQPDKAFDCVVTDPPYGIGENNRKNLSRANAAASIDYGEFTWDSQPATQEQINEIIRVSRNQVIFGGNYFSLPPSPGWIVWDKLQTGDFADCELAYTSYKRAVRKFTYLWNGMIKQRPEERFHPTQKPLTVMKWILENYTQPGDTILDPFAGSGTTLVAAIQTGRNAIGVERDPGYFKIMSKRIADAQQQMRLPMEVE